MASTFCVAACQSASALRPPELSLDTTPPNMVQVIDGSRLRQSGDQSGFQTKYQERGALALHLAQRKPEPGLVPVSIDDRRTLYALPMPVFIQNDISRIGTLFFEDKESFLVVEMSQNSNLKLKEITEGAKGHYFLLSMQGNLISLAPIEEQINDKRLFFSIPANSDSR